MWNQPMFVEGDKVLVDGYKIGWVTGMTIDGKVLVRDHEDMYSFSEIEYVEYKRVKLYNDGDLSIRYGE